MPDPIQAPQPMRIRNLGPVNWLGLWTLYLKEVRRFMKIITQTILAPVSTSLLFLAIFALALAGTRPDVAGVPFLKFLAPGLIMMTLMQNAFANTSSSLMIAKVQGNIVDVLMPPLSPAEQTIAIAMGGLTRGLLVAVACGAAMWPFTGLHVHAAAAILFFAVSAALMMSLIGILGGIWAEKFDHIQALTNFVVTPLAFLSGTFYSVAQLPDFARSIAYANPFFYLIDGFRYGFTGLADSSLWLGAGLVSLINLVLGVACYSLFKSGYRLKA
ncbi:MAG: multidrug ABC transporter permease [Hyphomicrobiales bacterium]|nr:MAG: multidrug ABC transporter permease [Hyphomicrobiales bacterium]